MGSLEAASANGPAREDGDGNRWWRRLVLVALSLLGVLIMGLAWAGLSVTDLVEMVRLPLP
jgi:hypothetical protein